MNTNTVNNPVPAVRQCAGYTIINAVRIDSTHEIVIGHHPTAPSPFVVWDCINGDDYSTGRYCASFRQALLKLAEIIQGRRDFIPVEYHC